MTLGNCHRWDKVHGSKILQMWKNSRTLWWHNDFLFWHSDVLVWGHEMYQRGRVVLLVICADSWTQRTQMTLTSVRGGDYNCRRGLFKVARFISEQDWRKTSKILLWCCVTTETSGGLICFLFQILNHQNKVNCPQHGSKQRSAQKDKQQELWVEQVFHHRAQRSFWLQKTVTLSCFDLFL